MSALILLYTTKRRRGWKTPIKSLGLSIRCNCVFAVKSGCLAQRFLCNVPLTLFQGFIGPPGFSGPPGIEGEKVSDEYLPYLKVIIRNMNENSCFQPGQLLPVVSLFPPPDCQPASILCSNLQLQRFQVVGKIVRNSLTFHSSCA